MEDIRDVIFKDIINQEYRAVFIPERDGYLSGVSQAMKRAEEIGARLTFYCAEGSRISKGEPIGQIVAKPKSITIAEEKIIGELSKFSGIATATREAVALADGKLGIVSGSWKKMPPGIKDGIRQAVVTGGGSVRISNTPMIYLDKNYIRMLGSIPAALNAVKECTGFTKVIQIKGIQETIEEETVQAVENGCGILMVDTGKIRDAVKCSEAVARMGARGQVKIAFAGGVTLGRIRELCQYDIDLLCIGKEIVDAPLLDIRMDVQI